MSVTFSDLRPDRTAAAAMLSCMRATFLLMNIITATDLRRACAGRERPRDCAYIIAVGGAGSLGSPAFLSGTPIITHAIRSITNTPVM